MNTRSLAGAVTWLALSACAGSGISGTDNLPDVGATLGTACMSTENCPSNLLCRFSQREGRSVCSLPDGSCTPERVAVDCYSDARCDTSSGAAGQCSFRPPARAVFGVAQPITLERPNRQSDLPESAGVLLQWSPPRGLTGAVTVAAIMNDLPSLDVATGRIRNQANVKWIWSSAEPGGPVMEGTVPLRYGRAGVTREGRLGPTYAGDTLPAGLYYWFVFATVQGEVVASSVAQVFRVGRALPDLRSCNSVSDCFETAADAALFDCVSNLCRRRCASNLDCEVGTCAFDEAPPPGQRRGAYCGQSGPTDAGVAARD